MPERTDWMHRWAVVAGGTSGLGLAIAQKLAAKQAKVALIGRDRSKLDAAMAMLRSNGAADVIGFAVDLSRELEPADEDAQSLMRFCEREAIKICIAAVGTSDRGYLNELTVGDIQQAIGTNVVSAWQIGKMCASSLAREIGSLVHIGSIAGLAAAPGLGTYCLSKAALIAMSRQLRQELKSKGVYVTLVCTGPVARDDAGTRYQHLADARQLPENLQLPGGGVDLDAIDAGELADQILQAAAVHREEVILPKKVKMLSALTAMMPSVADAIIRKKMASKSDESHH